MGFVSVVGRFGNDGRNGGASGGGDGGASGGGDGGGSGCFCGTGGNSPGLFPLRIESGKGGSGGGARLSYLEYPGLTPAVRLGGNCGNGAGEGEDLVDCFGTAGYSYTHPRPPLESRLPLLLSGLRDEDSLPSYSPCSSLARKFNACICFCKSYSPLCLWRSTFLLPGYGAYCCLNWLYLSATLSVAGDVNAAILSTSLPLHLLLVLLPLVNLSFSLLANSCRASSNATCWVSPGASLPSGADIGPGEAVLGREWERSIGFGACLLEENEECGL